MDLKGLNQLFTFRDLRAAAIGTLVVVSGVGLSFVTIYAHRNSNPRLASIAAGLSLAFILLILLFVVPPLARNASREASQLNLPFELTVGGAIMIGLIIIVGFSAWNTGNNLLFLVLSFLLATMAVSFIAGSLCLKRLDVKMRFPETIFADEETPILVSINNGKRLLPTYSVVIEVRGTQNERSLAAAELERLLPLWLARRIAKPPVIRRTLNYFSYIPQRSAVESSATHTFPHRGRFLIKDFELSTKFPLALFRHRRRLPARATDLIVFPRPEPLDPELRPLLIDTGNISGGRKGSGQDLFALRGYQPNDDPRQIDWKATARSRGLIVREFAAENDRRVTVYFDRRVPPEPDRPTIRRILEREQRGEVAVSSERLETGISRTAAILKMLTEEKAEISLAIDGTAGQFGIGVVHFYDMLRRLATVEPDFADRLDIEPLAAFAAEQTGSTALQHIFFITAAENELPAELSASSDVIRF